MEVFFFLLIVLLAGSFIMERIFKTAGEKKYSGHRGSALPDLADALKNEKARKEFGARLNIGQTKAPGIKRAPGQPPLPESVDVPDEPLAPKVCHEAKLRERVEVDGFLTVSIEKIFAPEAIEQGQRDCAVKLLAKTLSAQTVEIASIQLRFQWEESDVSAEYTVRAQAGNSIALTAGRTYELKLMVEAAEGATLGEIAITPSIFAQINGGPLAVQISGKRTFRWQVEPSGREFKILTEHRGTETAGMPFYLDISTCRDGNDDLEYIGMRRVHFTLQGSHAIAHAADIPEYLDLEFEQGKARTPQVFCIYNTFESCTIYARDRKPGGGQGKSDAIELLPGRLESFQLDVSSPQTVGVPFQGENVITAMDPYSNIKVDYQGDVEILCNVLGEIYGLSSGNVVSGSSFVHGVARLTGLTFQFSEEAQQDASYGEEGKIIQLIACAEGKFGYSDDISILPSIPLNATETQAVIQRLLGFRKRKIWLINCEEELGQILAKSFQPKYDVVSIESAPEEIANKFGSSLPDVVFLDDGIPARDGFLILQKICRNPALEGIPVLFLGSPSVSESKITDILRMGSIYLTKPPHIAAVRAIVTDLIDQKAIGRGRLPNQGTRLPGSEGNSYQIVAKIGEGGMGYIYEARKMRDQQRVIVKYLPPRDLQNIKSIVRFVQEAHAVLSFQHENLVCGYDLYMDRNRCFYVMEYIEGESLEQRLLSTGRLQPAQATRIVLQVGRALQALEHHQLVHRDIKPANILVTPEGLVKLVDFGIAKVTNHKLTTMGIILGTPYYLSPEQIKGENITIQSDIYSLGATFYHLVTGEVPFQGTDVYSIIHQRLRQNNLRDPREYNPAIPKAISDIIIKMMQLKPRRRYATPLELIQKLEHVLQVIDSGALALEEEQVIEDETSEDQNLPSMPGTGNEEGAAPPET